MLILVFVLPLVAALLSLALNRVLSTRVIGLVAAGALALTTFLLLTARLDALSITQREWLTFETQTIPLTLTIDAARRPLAVLVAGGGALAILALALALPAGLRGFGGLVAALLLLLDAAIGGIALQEALLLPFAWAAIALLSFAAVRASGGQAAAQSLPLGLIGGLLGAVLLLGSTLSIGIAGAGGELSAAALAGLIVTSLLSFGAPPFHRTVSDIAEAPSNVAGPLIALGLPFLGAVTLTNFAAQTTLPEVWRTALVIMGLFTMFVCGAGALNSYRLRQVIGWVMSAQSGLLLVVLGQSQTALTIIAPPLIMTIALTSLVSYTAAALLERRAGTDDIREIRLSEPLLAAGLALAIAIASALGFPGTWGFWPRQWLFDELGNSMPWAIAPVIAAHSLLAISCVYPVLALWRATPQRSREAPGFETPIAQICPLLAVAPLLVLGIGPQLGWRAWGEQTVRALLLVEPTTVDPPRLPGILGMALGSLAVLGLVGLPLLLVHRGRRKTLADPEVTTIGAPAPEALGTSLRGLAWLGAPSNVFGRAWEGLTRASKGLAWALGFFEQRYYVAGLMIALVAVVLLMLQG